MKVTCPRPFEFCMMTSQRKLRQGSRCENRRDSRVIGCSLKTQYCFSQSRSPPGLGLVWVCSRLREERAASSSPPEYFMQRMSQDQCSPNNNSDTKGYNLIHRIPLNQNVKLNSTMICKKSRLATLHRSKSNPNDRQK